MANIALFLLLLFFQQSVSSRNPPRLLNHPQEIKYEPKWSSLDSRPLPDWYDKAKIGIFLHWGVFSVPSFGSEWFWINWEEKTKEYVEFMQKNYPPGFSYQEFAKEFTAEFFDPDQWAELFKNSGAKYVVLTSKHHEGYTLWPSKYSFGWNSQDVGPNSDLIGDLSKAVRAKDLEFGLYHSLFEWYHPLYLSDKSHLFLTNEFARNKVLPEMNELILKYEPSVLWSDGDWEALDAYWNSTGFLAWLYNDSPVKDKVVVNDRWGIGTPCKHGDFYTCQDRYNPGVLQPHKWENAMTIDRRSWGFRRNANISDYLTTHDLITTLTETISCGGNLLINVGPTKEGTIAPVFQERLLDLGTWLGLNGEAIYESKPWSVQNDTLTSGVWYTSDESNVYAIVLKWPGKNILKLKSVVDLFKKDVIITLLGNSGKLKATIIDGAANIQFPDKATAASQWAWVLKFQI